jgi:hypothetical protein
MRLLKGTVLLVRSHGQKLRRRGGEKKIVQGKEVRENSLRRNCKGQERMAHGYSVPVGGPNRSVHEIL